MDPIENVEYVRGVRHSGFLIDKGPIDETMLKEYIEYSRDKGKWGALISCNCPSFK
jgi:hypothetical protein